MRETTLVLAILIALSAGGCAQKKPPPPPPPTVAAAHPLQRDVVDWDEFSGRFEAIQSAQVQPRVSGQISRIAFRPGVEVKQGQFLFELDPRPFRAALAQAQGNEAAAVATLANARTEFARAGELLKVRAVAQEEYEQRQANLRSAEANLKTTRAAVVSAALDLEFTTIRSPIAGRVSDKRVSLGDNVVANQTLLTTVVMVDPIWFSFDGAETFYLKYIRQAESGERPSSRYAPNPVDIQLADENTYRWHGRMSFVDNAIDTTSGTIRAHATVTNPQGILVPGMFGRARLLGSGTYRAMLVPDEAVVTDQNRRLVYVVGKDGKVATRGVELGPLVMGLRVIKSGLTPGDSVVLDGLAGLKSGAQVQVRMTKIEPQAADDSPTAPPPLIAPESFEATTR
jgi:RND family efflux transporter MFP subunit